MLLILLNFVYFGLGFHLLSVMIERERDYCLNRFKKSELNLL